jgi:DME family drug/metabolite transporter
MRRNSLSAILVVLAAGLLWGTVGPAEMLAHSQAGPVAVGGARILSGGLVLAAITLIGNPGAFRALPRDAWPSLLAASAATATFQGTFLTSAARLGGGYRMRHRGLRADLGTARRRTRRAGAR